MSVDTHGKIKGFVRHEEILNFIRQKWDKDARDDVKKRTFPRSMGLYLRLVEIISLL